VEKKGHFRRTKRKTKERTVGREKSKGKRIGWWEQTLKRRRRKKRRRKIRKATMKREGIRKRKSVVKERCIKGNGGRWELIGDGI
jgi:hypothetical protein